MIFHLKDSVGNYNLEQVEWNFLFANDVRAHPKNKRNRLFFFLLCLVVHVRSTITHYKITNNTRIHRIFKH